MRTICMSIRRAMIVVLIVMMALVLAILVLVVLWHVHLHLVPLMGLCAVQQRMLTRLMIVTEHAIGWRVRARRSVRRGIVIVKA